MRTTIDSAGRIVIPRDIRKAAGLGAGMEVDVEVSDEGVVSIQPTRGNVRLVKQGRFLVAESVTPVPKIGTKEVNAVLRRIRNERERKLRG